MEKSEAIRQLKALLGKDLSTLALEYEFLNELDLENGSATNKGWAGHTVERFLGLPINSAQSPNLGTWELKVVPVVEAIDGKFNVKETVAITMIDPQNIVRTKFENSHLFTKLRKIITVVRLVRDNTLESKVLSCNSFQLEETNLYRFVSNDYNEIQKAYLSGNVTGHIGTFIQARTKGSGHGSTTRAFYAKKILVEHMIGLTQIFDVDIGHAVAPLDKPKKNPPNNLKNCDLHAGKSRSGMRSNLDELMLKLPANQSGNGRHKCPYCAYQAGFQAGMAAIANVLEPQYMEE